MGNEKLETRKRKWNDNAQVVSQCKGGQWRYHCKKKWVTSVSYPFPHDWTISLAKYSPVTFANVLESQI